MIAAVYAGSFDPPTWGHVSVVRQASRAFDHVRVLVAVHPTKEPLFPPDERVAMLREILGAIPNVSVDMTDGLVVEYARAIGAQVLIRGVRAVQDAAEELEFAALNHDLAPELSTILVTAAPDLAQVRSSEMKARAKRGEDVFAWCPAPVWERLRGRAHA